MDQLGRYIVANERRLAEGNAPVLRKRVGHVEAFPNGHGFRRLAQNRDLVVEALVESWPETKLGRMGSQGHDSLPV